MWGATRALGTFEPDFLRLRPLSHLRFCLGDLFYLEHHKGFDTGLLELKAVARFDGRLVGRGRRWYARWTATRSRQMYTIRAWPAPDQVVTSGRSVAVCRGRDTSGVLPSEATELFSTSTSIFRGQMPLRMTIPGPLSRHENIFHVTLPALKETRKW